MCSRDHPRTVFLFSRVFFASCAAQKSHQQSFRNQFHPEKKTSPMRGRRGKKRKKAEFKRHIDGIDRLNDWEIFRDYLRRLLFNDSRFNEMDRKWNQWWFLNGSSWFKLELSVVSFVLNKFSSILIISVYWSFWQAL